MSATGKLELQKKLVPIFIPFSFLESIGRTDRRTVICNCRVASVLKNLTWAKNAPEATSKIFRNNPMFMYTICIKDFVFIDLNCQHY